MGFRIIPVAREDTKQESCETTDYTSKKHWLFYSGAHGRKNVERRMKLQAHRGGEQVCFAEE